MSIKETRQLLDKNKGYLRVKVLPCSSKNEITEIMVGCASLFRPASLTARGVMDDETVKIRIAAPPEKGKANKELIKFLSKELSVSKEQITIISGKTEPVKLVKISDARKS